MNTMAHAGLCILPHLGSITFYGFFCDGCLVLSECSTLMMRTHPFSSM